MRNRIPFDFCLFHFHFNFFFFKCQFQISLFNVSMCKWKYFLLSFCCLCSYALSTKIFSSESDYGRRAAFFRLTTAIVIIWKISRMSGPACFGTFKVNLRRNVNKKSTKYQVQSGESNNELTARQTNGNHFVKNDRIDDSYCTDADNTDNQANQCHTHTHKNHKSSGVEVYHAICESNRTSR